MAPSTHVKVTYTEAYRRSHGAMRIAKPDIFLREDYPNENLAKFVANGAKVEPCDEDGNVTAPPSEPDKSSDEDGDQDKSDGNSSGVMDTVKNFFGGVNKEQTSNSNPDDNANAPKPGSVEEVALAIGGLDKDNADLFTKVDGKPLADVLSNLLKREVSGDDRDKAWEMFKAQSEKTG